MLPPMLFNSPNFVENHFMTTHFYSVRNILLAVKMWSNPGSLSLHVSMMFALSNNQSLSLPVIKIWWIISFFFLFLNTSTACCSLIFTILFNATDFMISMILLKIQRVALEHGLILVDTKYEFGKGSDGSILLIDEVRCHFHARIPWYLYFSLI